MLRLTSLSVFVFAVSLLSTPDPVVLQTFRYTIVSNGKTAGSEVDTYSPDGHIDSLMVKKVVRRAELLKGHRRGFWFQACSD
jgi:hypothetical protein